MQNPKKYIGKNITIHGRVNYDFTFYRECYGNKNLYFIDTDDGKIYFCTYKTFTHKDRTTITGELKNITIPFPNKQILMVEDGE